MKHVVLTETSGILTVKLNRPERHNAFHPEMISELTALFLKLDSRADLRAVILRGEGKSFCAGGDLEWMKSMVRFSHEENLHDARALFDMFSAMAECRHPVFGMVHGHVMGGGLGLVAVCDVVMAEGQTRFAFSEARIGISPAVISPFVLRKSTQGLMREMMLTAKAFSAEQAHRYGLVHYVGSTEQCEQHLKTLILDIQQCGPEAVREAKRLLNFLSAEPWPKYRDRCAEVIAQRRASGEGQEGLKAFLEKREPAWRKGNS